MTVEITITCDKCGAALTEKVDEGTSGDNLMDLEGWGWNTDYPMKMLCNECLEEYNNLS